MRIARSLHVFPDDAEMPDTWAYTCRVCRSTIHGYSTRHFAIGGARRHYGSLPHLLAEKERTELERWVDAVISAAFALVGIEEAQTA